MLAEKHSTISIRPLNLDEDYPLLMAWWEVHGVPLLDKAIFPRDGAVAIADNRPVAMAFLYIGRTPTFAMLEWTTTNPATDISPRHKLAGVKALYDHLEMEARLWGCLCVLSMVAPKTSEDRIMQRMGWKPQAASDKPHVMFAKRLTR